MTNARLKAWLGVSLGIFWAATAVAQEVPIPAPVPEPVAEEASATRSARPTIEFGGLLHVQYEGGDTGDARFAGAGDRIYLRRARLNAQGRFLEDFDYRVEFDLAGSLSSTSSLRAQLTDGFVTWTRYPAAMIRFGQFKTPFGFEQLIPDPRLLFVERSLVNDRLTVGRQLGVQVGGAVINQRVSYSLGAFNGNGANNNFNDNDKFLVAGRLTGLLFRRGSDESESFWSVAANAYSSDDADSVQPPEFGFDSTPATVEADNLFVGRRTALGVDSQFRAGAFDLMAEYLRVEWSPEAIGADIESDGFYLQGLWSFGARRFQVMAKYDEFDPRNTRPLDSTSTWTAGFNWYLRGHDLKWVTNLQRVDVGPLDTQTKLLTRFQLAF